MKKRAYPARYHVKVPFSRAVVVGDYVFVSGCSGQTLETYHASSKEPREQTEVAMDKVKTQVKPRQYQMFYLHVVRDMDAKRVARKLSVKLPEVYYAKYKVSALIKREMKILEEKMT